MQEIETIKINEVEYVRKDQMSSPINRNLRRVRAQGEKE